MKRENSTPLPPGEVAAHAAGEGVRAAAAPLMGFHRLLHALSASLADSLGTSPRGRGVAALFIATALVAGCNGRGADPPARKYVTPSETLSLAELIAALNERSAQIESLYLEGSLSSGAGGFEARLREGRDKPERFVNGEITALYLAPDRLRLRGNKDIAGLVFDLGTDGERFWMHLPTEGQLYYGTFAGLDPETARQLPIRPDRVLEVLGVSPLDTDLLETPAPMLRYNPDSDVYMLTWAEPVDGPPPRWNVVKEVWYDRETLLPRVVILFDGGGDPVVRAYLSEHQPIGGEDGPKIASRYDLYFLESGSRMWLDFGELNFRNPQSPRHPQAASFKPPDPGSVADTVDLDRPIQRAAPSRD